MKWRLVLFLAAFTLVFSMLGREIFVSANHTSSTANESTLNLPDAHPIILNDTLYVPIRSVAEAFGAEVGWSAEDNSITVSWGYTRLVLKSAQKRLLRFENDILVSEKHMDVTPVIVNGRTLLPIHFLSEEFGYDIDWKPGAQTVVIYQRSSNESLEKFETAPKPTPKPTPESDSLKAPVDIEQPTPIPDSDREFELEVLRLTNAERAKAGLPPLSWDDRLAAAARKYSTDMRENKFFSHTNQEGLGPADRMRREGFHATSYGENIARGQQTPQDVVNAWMDSPGHRSNILHAGFTHIGVGFDEYYWTQKFGGGLREP